MHVHSRPPFSNLTSPGCPDTSQVLREPQPGVRGGTKGWVHRIRKRPGEADERALARTSLAP